MKIPYKTSKNKMTDIKNKNLFKKQENLSANIMPPRYMKKNSLMYKVG